MNRRLTPAGSVHQSTDAVLMIRPARFLSNPQTAASNAFQNARLDAAAAQAGAIAQFDTYAAALRQAGVTVVVVEDTPEPHTPDSIFPNNWLGTDRSGRVFLFPMQAPNRRLERRMAVLAALEARFEISEIVDLGRFAARERFLEGTGSMVCDHDSRTAFVCRSPRSHPEVMAHLSALTGYQPVWFSAVDARGQPIYHTNVMMCVGDTIAIVCMASIPCVQERRQLAAALARAGKRIIEISLTQMTQFAGNMLELRAATGAPLFAASRRAWDCLDGAQQARIRACATPVLAALDTIEEAGGGGARCMLAEIFLPRRTLHSL